MPISTSLTPMEFTIPALDTYVDLNMSYFVAQVRFEQPDGRAIADASTVYPNPNLIHTMIKQFNMSWNGVLLNPQTDTYAYRAWIPKLLNYTQGEADTLLALEGWWDTELKKQVSPIEPPRALTVNLVNFADNNGAGHVDITRSPPGQEAFLWAMNREKAKFYNKAWNTFIFKSQHELFYSHRLTLPGIEQKFNFSFRPQKFYMNGIGVGNMAVKELEPDNFKMCLVLCLKAVNPILYKKIDVARHSQRRNAVIRTMRNEIRTYTLAKNIVDFNESNMFQGRIPQRMVVGLVESDAFNGNRLNSPFSFQKYSMLYIEQVIRSEEYA